MGLACGSPYFLMTYNVPFPHDTSCISYCYKWTTKSNLVFNLWTIWCFATVFFDHVARWNSCNGTKYMASWRDIVVACEYIHPQRNLSYVISPDLWNLGSVGLKSIKFTLYLNPGREPETPRKYEVVVVVVWQQSASLSIWSDSQYIASRLIQYSLMHHSQTLQ